MKLPDKRKKRKSRITIDEINRYTLRSKVLKGVAVAASIILAIIYLFAMFYEQNGSFTISVNKHEMVKYGLSLCENRDLTSLTSVLNMRIDEQITNISQEDLPKNLDNIDGAHCGDNYLAFTFYLYNASDVDTLSYEWQIKMSNISNGIDEAIRIRHYINGTPTTYAKTSSDGSGPEPGTTEFYSTNIIARGRVDDFVAGGVTKNTLVVWLEGPDPDCLDWIKGGQMYVEMDISVAH